MISSPDLSRLQQRLDYQFSDVNLLNLALTHRSFSSHNNERLEFLGDSLLNNTIAQQLFHQFPDVKEGMLSRLRSRLVKGVTLAEIAREFSLSDYLILGEGEMKSGGFRRDSILADAVEAIIGAIFLDSDIATCQTKVLQWFEHRLQHLSVEDPQKDPKTQLQELLQAKKLPLPLYDVVTVDGASHEQLFTVSCRIALLKETVSAKAPSRRSAEKAVAQLILDKLNSIAEGGIDD